MVTILEALEDSAVLHADNPQNRALLDQGRRAWRASGQGQSRECRVWDERRRTKPRAGVRRSRRFYESVGSPWSDAHTLRTFDAWMAEELGR